MKKKTVDSYDSKQILTSNTSRREFIKKSVYITPKLVVLGYLTQPIHTIAEGEGPPDGPSSPPVGGTFTNNGFGG